MPDIQVVVQKLKRLSRRELEVFQERCQGKSIADIADTLVIVESTVKHHLGNIYAKLELDHLPQAARNLEIPKFCEALPYVPAEELDPKPELEALQPMSLVPVLEDELALVQQEQGIIQRWSPGMSPPNSNRPFTQNRQRSVRNLLILIISTAVISGLAGAGIMALIFTLTTPVVPPQPQPPPPLALSPQATPALVPTITPSSTLSPTLINDNFADDAPIVLVPAGPFEMGSNSQSDEQPVHEVTLAAFYIDQYEVTNAQYRRCVEAGGCELPGCYPYPEAYEAETKKNYPVVCVSWYQAQKYCEWRGGRLPTEAEWEKAARGTDGRIWPWGDKPPDKTLLNFNRNVNDITSVGSYSNGISPYGAYDMAGNVWEWVADWYDEKYYSNSPAENPPGPLNGDRKVLRGGAWYDSGYVVRASYRYYSYPYEQPDVIGIRCVAAAPNETPPSSLKLINDNFADALVIHNLPFSDSLNLKLATTEVGEPLLCAYDVGGDQDTYHTVWYRFTPANTVGLYVNMKSEFVADIGIYSGSSLDSLSQSGCVSGGGDWNRTALPATFIGGATYYLQIGSILGGTVDFKFELYEP
ncbi:MAG: SUMF1/EgtB/PvdO family nonheme iron enzyme [Chloroflexi bacterium]|nr:SUMF1/EgtB/PvdO family nonheme iron enzyme [Chloroflexota bacterium]